MFNKLFTQWAYSDDKQNWICVLPTKHASRLDQIVPFDLQAQAFEDVLEKGSFEWTIDNSRARLKIEVVN